MCLFVLFDSFRIGLFFYCLLVEHFLFIYFVFLFIFGFVFKLCLNYWFHFIFYFIIHFLFELASLCLGHRFTGCSMSDLRLSCTPACKHRRLSARHEDSRKVSSRSAYMRNAADYYVAWVYLVYAEECCVSCVLPCSEREP